MDCITEAGSDQRRPYIRPKLDTESTSATANPKNIRIALVEVSLTTPLRLTVGPAS